MLAIEDVVGAPAAGGVATRKSFFPSFVAAGHTQDTNHCHPGRDRSVKSLLSAPPDFWTPRIQVYDFLDDNTYPADAEYSRWRPLGPASSGPTRMLAVTKDVTSVSTASEQRCEG